MSAAAATTSYTTATGGDLTASELASVLGMTRQAATKALRDIPATGTRTVRGVEAQSWSVSVMRPDLRGRVLVMVKERGVRTPRDLLAQSVSPWQPSRPWAELHKDFTGEAIRKRDVLADIFTHHRDEPLPQLLERVRPAWRAVFGNVDAARLDADRLRYLHDRTIKRDRGFNQFHRPELYLDDAACHAHQPTAESIDDQSRHKPLQARVPKVDKDGELSAEERSNFFDHIFRHFEGLCSQTADVPRQREIKQSLIDWILAAFPCPFLALTAKAFRRAFDRDFSRWKNSEDSPRCPEALLKKPGEGGGRDKYLCKPCCARVNKRARELRGRKGAKGNTAMAYRQLRKEGEICVKCCGRYTFDLRKDKSYVPGMFVRHATPNDLEVAQDRGEKHALAIGPKIRCTWDDIDPGDYFVADDFTPGHMTWQEVDGKIEFGLLQIIDLEDLKSSNPIGRVAYIGSPNSLLIRRLYHRVFLKGVGPPRRGVLHEGNVFAGRLLRGDEESKAQWNPWHRTEAALRTHYGLGLDALGDEIAAALKAEREMGLGQSGLDLEVRRAIHPWSKPIEGSFHIRQAMLSRVRGFVGFRQRDEMPDDLKDFIRRVKAGNEHPDKHFPSVDEFLAEYDKVCDEYRHEPQPRSVRLRGATPFEAWTEGTSRRRLEKLPDEMSYAIATHKLPMTLGPSGLNMTICGVRRTWADDRLGEWYGARNIRDVIGYWHIENPELLTITDVKGKNHLTLRTLSASRMHATKAETAQNEAAKKGFIAQATARYSIQPSVANTIKSSDDFTDEQKAIGRHMKGALLIEKQRVAEEAATPRRSNRLAEAYGLAASGNVMDAPARRAPSARKQELRDRLAAKNRSTPNQTQA